MLFRLSLGFAFLSKALLLLTFVGCSSNKGARVQFAYQSVFTKKMMERYLDAMKNASAKNSTVSGVMEKLFFECSPTRCRIQAKLDGPEVKLSSSTLQSTAVDINFILDEKVIRKIHLEILKMHPSLTPMDVERSPNDFSRFQVSCQYEFCRFEIKNSQILR